MTDIDIDQAAASAYELAHKFSRAREKASWKDRPNCPSAAEISKEFFAFLTQDSPGSLPAKMAALGTQVDHVVDLIEQFNAKNERFARIKGFRALISFTDTLNDFTGHNISYECHQVRDALGGEGLLDAALIPPEAAPSIDLASLLKDATRRVVFIENLSSSNTSSVVLPSRPIAKNKGV